ncbi:hypothetical protein JOD54_000626 [Actinokineospora baliensis]|uniref:sunset domain-containing protein n=1 Tax=Actinokineospora baliensis TaxID=547056 RepID=UPI0027DD5368|nr:hypothetical protein [Actinokineospora baliensis]MBM7770422.1 hypothetical protein [Actinokineospora baliensis]
MPFFGQVWVYSLAGFLVGAALCWVLIALPARKRVTELQDRLTAVRKRESRLAAEDSGYTSAALVPGFGDSRDGPGYVQPQRPAKEGEESIRRGLLTLSDEDEDGLRALPAPAPHEHHDDHDEHHDDLDRRDDRDEHVDRDDRDDLDERDEVAPAGERDWDREPEPETAAELTQYIPPATEHGEDYREEQRGEDYRDDAEADPERDWFGDRAPGDRLVDDLDETDRPGDDRVADDDDRSVDDRAADDRADEDEPEYLADRGDDEYERSDETGTIFTQHTTPIPAELIRSLDEGKSADDYADDVPARTRVDDDAALVDDLDGEPDYDRTGYLDPHEVDGYGDHAARGELTEDRYQDPVVEQERYDDERPVEEPALLQVDATQFVPVVRDEPVEVEPVFEPDTEPERQPAHAALDSGYTDPSTAVTDPPGFQQPIEPTPAYGQATPERNSSVLPKRIPSKPQNRFPFGVQTATATATTPAPAPVVPEPEPALQTTPDRERSLFEPILPADLSEAKQAPPPPPNRLRGARTLQQSPTGMDPFVPPGPFGPGSAMPLPGGRSPSSEYTIKASVTALRYCAPESAKFDRTVAEVWFRSVADAERVGFRPLA